MSGEPASEYGARRAAYDIKKLRGKDMMRKIGASRRYQPLHQGLRALTALVVLCEKVIRPLLAASTRPQAHVDDLITTGVLRRLLAFTDLNFSNSMIEAWWRSLKHQWLFLHPLDSVSTVRRLVAFYVDQHNRVLPHSAFRGQTPDEMY
jgi:hypothetical protein